MSPTSKELVDDRGTHAYELGDVAHF